MWQILNRISRIIQSNASEKTGIWQILNRVSQIIQSNTSGKTGMWQILNRISRIIQSNTSEKTNTYKAVESEDDELKRIIDELNSDKSKRTYEQQSQNSNPKNDELTKAFNTLGIPPNSDAQAIKTAYRNKMKEYHPDRFVKLGKELQEKSRKKSQEINIAYDALQKAGYVK